MYPYIVETVLDLLLQLTHDKSGNSIHFDFFIIIRTQSKHSFVLQLCPYTQ
jgi:hypothetical protein